jgi:pantetheine-phosphate adenylyltransferase
MFGVEERKALIREAMPDPRVEVDSFEGLLVHYTRRKGVHTILRGLRAVSDFEFEFQLANMNRKLDPDFDTVFMMTGQDSFYISSQLVREWRRWAGTSPSWCRRTCSRRCARSSPRRTRVTGGRSALQRH